MTEYKQKAKEVALLRGSTEIQRTEKAYNSKAVFGHKYELQAFPAIFER